VLGDDPHALLLAELPAAVVAGPLADPTPYLRAARAVVTLGRDVEGVLALSWACGTPAFTAPENDADGERLADALSGLLGSDALFATLAPIPVPEPGPSLIDPLAALEAPYRRASGRIEAPARVRLVGAIDSLESLAQVNRELAVRLARPGQPFSFSVLAPGGTIATADVAAALDGVEVVRRGAPLASVDLEIRHQWPPDFSAPARGRLVIVQPWEFGGLPAEWVGPLRDVADDLWVPTSWVRESAIESGIDPGRVHVVPNGVDVARYRPEGARFPLRTRRRTKLLFVGGLIERKGVDALLEAYLSTFRSSDDVCLIIKPFGSASVYAGSTLEPAVRRAAAGDGPEIELVDGDLSFAEMAALYRSCHALVHPYRGEGFGLPIAEAMASGLPVIVPDAGASQDFCDDDVAFLVAARRVALTPSEWTPTAAGSWWFEPSRQGLAAAMHAVVADPSFAQEKGAAARRRIVERFTWDHAGDAAAARLSELLGLDVAPPQRERVQVA
jgi:glycosyltransferase involved in cell wall biosynthesis